MDKYKDVLQQYASTFGEHVNRLNNMSYSLMCRMNKCVQEIETH